MPSRVFPLRVVALVTLLVAVPQASAGPITWSYQGQVVTTGPSSGINGEPLGPRVLVATDFPHFSGFFAPDNQMQFADVAGLGSGSRSVTAFQLRASTTFSYTSTSPRTSTRSTWALASGTGPRALLGRYPLRGRWTAA